MMKAKMENMPRKEDMSEENRREWKEIWLGTDESRDQLGLFTSTRNILHTFIS